MFYCQPQCLETALIGELTRLETLAPAPPPPNRIPLGLLMVARGRFLEVEREALNAYADYHDAAAQLEELLGTELWPDDAATDRPTEVQP